MRDLENSAVPPPPVAAAVTRQLTGPGWLGTKAKEALPRRLVLTLVWPMKVLPSPKPEGSASAPGLEKNWTVRVLLGVELRSPLMVVELVEPVGVVKAEEIPG